jgi:large subunit ribosomal protein L23
MKSVVNYKYYDVIRYPVVTEKSNMSGEANQYTFVVDLNANKHDIKDAVEKIFNVKVLAVNTLIRKGKRKVFKGRKGVQSDLKKAMVRLEAGQRIDLTAGV